MNTFLVLTQLFMAVPVNDDIVEDYINTAMIPRVAAKGYEVALLMIPECQKKTLMVAGVSTRTGKYIAITGISMDSDKIGEMREYIESAVENTYGIEINKTTAIMQDYNKTHRPVCYDPSVSGQERPSA